LDIGPLVVPDSVEALNAAYRAEGVALPPTQRLADASAADLRRALVIGPAPADDGRFAGARKAFASGWMQLRRARRQQGLDRGFVLSDHADWPGLQTAIAATGAERVIVTHGSEDALLRWLTEQGLQAGRFETVSGDE
jgi:putative mRNA 3-end processing factor